MAENKETQCVVFGAGGHAKVVIDSLLESHAAFPVGILDSDPSRWGKEVCRVPILGGDDIIPELEKRGVTAFVVGVGSVGDNRNRVRLFDLGVSSRLTPLVVKHPSATCSRWARLGEGTVLLPGSIVNSGAVLGRNVIVNTGAIVEHDCVVGDHVHIATGARLSGSIQVAASAHVGAGAVVRQNLCIGEGAIIGAGAVVVKDVPEGAVVAGVPAEPIGALKKRRLGMQWNGSVY